MKDRNVLSLFCDFQKEHSVKGTTNLKILGKDGLIHISGRSFADQVLFHPPFNSISFLFLWKKKTTFHMVFSLL